MSWFVFCLISWSTLHQFFIYGPLTHPLHSSLYASSHFSLFTGIHFLLYISLSCSFSQHFFITVSQGPAVSRMGQGRLWGHKKPRVRFSLHVPRASLPPPKTGPAVLHLIFQCIHSLLHFLLSPILCFLIIKVPLLYWFFLSIHLPHLKHSNDHQSSPPMPLSSAPSPSICHFFPKSPSLGLPYSQTDQQHHAWLPCFCYNFWKASCKLLLFINSTKWYCLDSTPIYLKPM